MGGHHKDEKGDGGDRGVAKFAPHALRLDLAQKGGHIAAEEDHEHRQNGHKGQEVKRKMFGEVDRQGAVGKAGEERVQDRPDEVRQPEYKGRVEDDYVDNKELFHIIFPNEDTVGHDGEDDGKEHVGVGDVYYDIEGRGEMDRQGEKGGDGEDAESQ